MFSDAHQGQICQHESYRSSRQRTGSLSPGCNGTVSGPLSRRCCIFRRPVAKGPKRHILTDTKGLLVAAIVHEANVQNRDGRYRCWLQSARPGLECFMFSPMSAMRTASSKAHSPRLANGHSRPPRVSSCCQGIGSSSEREAAEPKSTTYQGFQGDHRERKCLAHDRECQAYDTQVGKCMINLLNNESGSEVGIEPKKIGVRQADAQRVNTA